MRGISPEKHGDFSVAIARNARSAIMTLFDAALSRLRSHTCEYAYANDENCDKKPSWSSSINCTAYNLLLERVCVNKKEAERWSGIFYIIFMEKKFNLASTVIIMI